MRLFLTGALMGAFFMLAVPAFAGDRHVDLMAKASPAVGALYKMEDDGDMSFLCSVTAIGHEDKATVLLTAFHCVTKGVSYRVTFDGKTYLAARVWKIPGYEVDDKKYRRAYHEPEVDMAMFLVDGADVPIMDLADAAHMEPGREIVTVGFPLGVAKVHYAGSVAGVFDRPGSNEDGYQLLQTFGAPGSSGSSILSLETGKIVSVLVSARQQRVGLPVIFATPIEYRRFLQEVPTGKEKQVGGNKPEVESAQ